MLDEKTKAIEDIEQSKNELYKKRMRFVYD